MFRLSNFYSLRLGLLGLCILAAAGIGCSEAAAPAPPVDCEAQCPCACGQRGTPSQTPPSPAPVMPERGHTYAVFLAGNVRVAEGKIPLALAQKKVEAERERL